MAISLRGSAENSKTTVIGTDTMTLTHPVGIAENDVAYVSSGVGEHGGGEGDVNMAMSTSGYTELADLFANDTDTTNFAVFRKRMTATPDSTAVCAYANVFGDEGWAAVEHVLAGVDTTTSEDATTTTVTGTNSGIPDSPSITTVTANAWVLTCGAGSVSDAAVTAPTGYSNQIDRNQDSLFGEVTVGMASKEVTSAGAENPGAWADWTTSINYSFCAVSVAVRPAAGGAAFAPPNVLAPRTLRVMAYGR